MTLIDYTDPLPTLGPPLTPEQRAAFRAMHERLKPALAAASANLFVFEARDNHYQPESPAGWFGMRSSTRRLFMQLTPSGGYPHPDEVQRRLTAGEYNEVPLTTP